MLVRSPAAPSCKAPGRVAVALDGAVAETSSRVVSACRRIPVRAVLAVATLLVTGGAGMWAVLAVAARLSDAG
ncbi:MAG: hypothetical protein JNL66_24125 [Alphaproteobacteria bacterium]|nr:hypothetical protein [Alphaproteobacteria bacterium]